MGGALLALGAAAVVSPALAQNATEAASWQSHKVTFNYLGIQPVYSCEGLENELTFLLQQSGARLDRHVAAYPCIGFGTPNKMLSATLNFSTLAPSSDSSGSQINAVWRHVEFSPNRSASQLRGADCELVEEFKDKVLPQFTTRNVQANLHCIPYQTTGYQFSLSFDVLADSDASPKSVGGTD